MIIPKDRSKMKEDLTMKKLCNMMMTRMRMPECMCRCRAVNKCKLSSCCFR